MVNAKKTKMVSTCGDKIFYGFINVFVVLMIIIVGVPLLHLLSASFSSPNAVVAGKVLLWPVNFSLEGYKAVFEHKLILTAYRNSMFYLVAGTAINIALTMIAAYPLSRSDMPGVKSITLIFTFTMIFHGGIIPGYLLVSGLGMLDTVWAMLIPGAISVYNLIVARSFIKSNVPKELLEAAQIDGCGDIQFFFRMVLPLSKAVIAVITLYYAIAHWNQYFNAMIYLNNQKLYPLQIVLKDILIANQINANMVYDAEMAEAKQGLSELLKYSLIVVSVIPVLIIYPFVQKHFVKGVMVGSVKG